MKLAILSLGLLVQCLGIQGIAEINTQNIKYCFAKSSPIIWYLGTTYKERGCDYYRNDWRNTDPLDLVQRETVNILRKEGYKVIVMLKPDHNAYTDQPNSLYDEVWEVVLQVSK